MRAKYILVSVVVAASFFISSTAFAQENNVSDAGITPDSPLYVFDRLGELLREFFTFNTEGKVRLQLTFAAERIAEIKAVLEAKGVSAKGLDIARARLEKHAQKAADLIEKEKGKGKDISKLAGEIVDEFHARREEAKTAFEEALQEFKTRKAELHEELLDAIKSGDEEAQVRIRTELEEVEAVKDAAEEKKDEIIESLEEEKERLQDELDEEKLEEEEMRDDEEEEEELEEEELEEEEEEKEAMIERCQGNIKGAQNSAEGKICTQEVTTVVCPHNNEVVYNAVNGCEKSFLMTKDWTVKVEAAGE